MRCSRAGPASSRRRGGDPTRICEGSRSAFTAAGDAEHGSLLMGEDAGLIDAIEPAGALVERLAADTESVLRTRSRELIG